MGNTLGGKRKNTTKIMKINGETIKLKTPVQAGEVVKDYPGLVLLDSEAVRHFGIRAKPLEPQQELKPKRLYFLIELPKFPEEKPTRRVRSGINMGAKDRLESLMLARRSVSDLSFMKAPSITVEAGGSVGGGGRGGGDQMRLKLRLPKAEVERLMMESRDEADAAERIMKLCMEKNGGDGGGGGCGRRGVASTTKDKRRVQWKDDDSDNGSSRGSSVKGHGKRVGFLPVSEEEIQLAMA